VPAGVELLVVMESVVLPELLNERGLNVDVVPAGNPLTLKLTVPAKLLIGEIVTV
jgi:hypothetical protein